MIKRTAQEWADFTGEQIDVGSDFITTTFYYIVIDSACISDFDKHNFGDIIKPKTTKEVNNERT
jgi:hypothetical protein